MKFEIIQFTFSFSISDLTFDSCHHRRAIWLMIEAVSGARIPAIGYDCDSWESFVQGQCVYDCNRDPFSCVRLAPINQSVAIVDNSLNQITVGRRYYMITANEKQFFRNYHLISNEKFSGKFLYFHFVRLSISNQIRYEI